MLSRSFLLIAVCLFFYSGFSQNTEELKRRLYTTKNNSEKTYLYYEIGKSFFDVNNDSILYYGEAAIQHGKETNDSIAISNGYNLKGVALSKFGNIEEAIALLYDALEIRMNYNDPEKIALTYLDIGNVNFNQGVNYEYKEDTINADREYMKALGHYNKALDYSFQSNDSIAISKSFQNIGAAYYRLYEYEKSISYNDSSYIWFPDSLKYLVFGSLKANSISCKHEMGIQVDIAEYQELIVHFKRYNLIEQWIEHDISLAVFYYNSIRVDEAIEVLNEADSLASMIKNAQYQLQVYDHLVELYKHKKNFKRGLHYHELYDSLTNKIAGVETSKLINELELKYNTEKTEKELANERFEKSSRELSIQRLKVTLIGAITFILALIIFILQRQRINRLKRKQIEEQHSREVTNLLSDQELKSVEAMLEGQDFERKRIAEDLHDRLGSTLSAAKMYVESSALQGNESENNKANKACELLDQAIDDARGIAHNLVSGTLSKFGLYAALLDLKETIEGAGQVKVSINFEETDSRFQSDIEINLYRIIQEAFSNALKHARASLLIIDLLEDQYTVNIFISDNGRGFNKNYVERGMGLKNIEARVTKLGGELEIESHRATGTRYHIKLNKKQHGN